MGRTTRCSCVDTVFGETAWLQFANSFNEDYSGLEDIWYKIDVDAPYRFPNHRQRMRLASDICLALDCGGLPQSAAAMGIHVDSFVLHLHQPEVADVVEGAISNFSSCVALCSLSSGLAGNGCGCFPGCQAACNPASSTGLAAGQRSKQFSAQSCSGLWHDPFRRVTAAARVDRYVGLILILHFGTFQLVALLWQGIGVRAEPIMSAPLRSTSLGEFWGKRWNLGFRQLAHELIFRPLYRKLGPDTAGFLVFVISGLIHDLVISLPARGGYGLPTLYFLLQGAGVTVERSRFGKRLGLGQGVRGWCLHDGVLVLPVFGLFHPWFVLRVILPFMQAIHAL